MEYMDLLPPTAPSLVFARETCTPYVVFHAPNVARLSQISNVCFHIGIIASKYTCIMLVLL